MQARRSGVITSDASERVRFGGLGSLGLRGSLAEVTEALLRILCRLERKTGAYRGAYVEQGMPLFPAPRVVAVGVTEERISPLPSAVQ